MPASLRTHGLFRLVVCMVIVIALWLAAAPAHAQLTFVSLHSFITQDGANPYAGLVQASDGNFYGTTAYGGTYGYGTTFKVTSAGVFTTLVSFNQTDGAYPEAALTQGNDGNFYGTTYFGGPSGDGTVFKITPSGVFTTLVNFNLTNGANPEAALVLGSDGNFYGTTSQGGGPIANGTVFKMTPGGVLTTLYIYNSSSDGGNPNWLTQGSDGNFYGTTGGTYGATMFEVTPAGSLTTLLNYNLLSFQSPNGLVLGSDGNFYGTTEYGGIVGTPVSGYGTVFKVTPAGVLTTLYTFTNGSDGANPDAGLIVGRDGNLYGTTTSGGMFGDGTVFKVTPAGAIITLYNFTGYPNYGTDRVAALVEGSDGNFYGTNYYGGASGDGMIFGLFGPPTTFGASETTYENTPLAFTVAFNDSSGKGIASVAFPTAPAHGAITVGAITETGSTGTVALTYTPAAGYTGADSLTYTVTSNVVGTSPPQAVTLTVSGPPTIVSFAPSSGSVGTSVVITGTNFTEVQSMTFDGTAAAFTVNSATQVTATVPAGATTGVIDVQTPGGIAVSTTDFTVVPPTLTFTLETQTSAQATFSAAATSSDGTALTYAWSVSPAANFTSAATGSTSSGTAFTNTLAPSAVGTYAVTVAVTDVHGSTAMATQNVTFSPVPVMPASVALGAASVYGGQTTTLTVTLAAPAPAGGLVVALTSNNTAAATLPAAVTVAAGQTVSPPVTVTTFPGFFMPTVTLTASANGGAATTTLQVDPPIIQSMTISPSQISGGGSATLTVTLNAPAPSSPVYGGGVLVSLACNNAAATVPSSLVIRQGATSATATIQTTAVSATQTATITGTADVSSGSAMLTIAVPPPTVTVTLGTQTATQATFSATATSGDGTPLHYTWVLYPNATPGFTGPTFGTAASGTPFSNTLSVSAAGSYGAIVSVTDAYGQSSTTNQFVTFSQIPAVVTVSPATAKLLEHGTQAFAATVKDQFGSAFTPASLTWSVSGGGTIDQSGNFTVGTTPGTLTVTASATSGGVTQVGTATVIVIAPPMVTITPGTQTPTQVSLSATATSGDSTALTYRWSVSPAATFTGATTGSIASGTPFTNTLGVTTAGTYTVMVTVTDVYGQTATATTLVTFTQIPTTVTVSPTPVSVAETGTQTFTVSVLDQFGTAIAAPAVTWSVSGGGTINASTGVFTAGKTPGTYTVTAAAMGSGVTTKGAASVTVINITPTITGFTPASGPAGTVVTITGTNLTGTSIVGFQGQHAKTFTVNSAGTQITTTVPANAATGPIAVLTPGGQAKSGTSFTVTVANPKPTITGFTPASGPAGTIVTITGTNLTGASIVGFQGQHAKTFTVNGAGTQITATVPTGAVTGPIAVLTPGGTVKSATNFTVTP